MLDYCLESFDQVTSIFMAMLLNDKMKINKNMHLFITLATTYQNRLCKSKAYLVNIFYVVSHIKNLSEHFKDY